MSQVATDVHIVNSPLPTQPCPAAQSRVEAELKKLEQFRFGTLNVPGKTIETVEIQSWAQVALVLKRLEAGAEVRLRFPEAASPADVAKISQEQKDIHDFLSTRHNFTITQTANLLVDKISKSWLFEGLDTHIAETFAEGWVRGRQFNPRKTDCLSVSHVYSQETLQDRTKTADMIAKLTATPTSPKVIFEVPIDKNDAAIKAVGTDLQSAVASNKISASCEVWVGDEKTSNPDDMLAFKFDDFIDHYLHGKPAVTIPPVGGDTAPAAGGNTPTLASSAWSAITTVGWWAWQPVRWTGIFLKWAYID